MRLFIAIDIPPEIKDKLEVLAFDLSKDLRSPVKLVERENYHINLKFLGEVADNNTEEIKNVIKQTIDSGLLANVQIKDILVFPDLNQPKIIGLQVVFANNLLKFSKLLINNLEQLQYIQKDNRIFQPHLTLGRVKFSLTKTEKDIVADIKFSDEFVANEICLYEIRLGTDGPVYNVIERYEIVNRGS